jgi:DNA-binding NtrC family response regulator
VPTLRDRRDDLPILIGRLLDRLNGELCTHVTSVSPQLLAWFNSHPFPGNIRELENLLRYGMLLCDDAVLDRKHYLDLDDWITDTDVDTEEGGDSPQGPLTMMVARATAELERTAITAALRQHRGNRSQAARALGIGRRTLFNKMQQYGVSAAKVGGSEGAE